MARVVRHACGLGLGLILLARSSAADQRERRAEELFQQGVTAGQQGDYERARQSFAASFELSPRGSTLQNMAIAEEREGRVLEGLRHLKAALSFADDAHRKSVEADIAWVYAEKAGRITLETTQGATIVVDGVPVEGVAPLANPIEVAPGGHHLTASLGGESVERNVSVSAGEWAHLSLPVVPPNPVAIAPVATTPPTAGPVALEPLMMQGPPPPPERSMATREFWTSRRLVGVVLGLAAAVPLGVAIGFQVDAASAESEAQGASRLVGATGCASSTRPTSCQTVADAYARQNSDADFSRVFGVVAAATLVTGAVLFLWPSSTSSSRTATVRPWIGPLGGGLGVRGGF